MSLGDFLRELATTDNVLAAARGGVSGMTAGFSKPLGAGAAVLIDKLVGTGKLTYEEARQIVEEQDRESRNQAPGLYTGAQLVGGLVPAGKLAGIARGGKQLIAGSAALGAAQGYNDTGTLEGTLAGGGAGALGGTFGVGAQKIMNAAVQKGIVPVISGASVVIKKTPKEVKQKLADTFSSGNIFRKNYNDVYNTLLSQPVGALGKVPGAENALKAELVKHGFTQQEVGQAARFLVAARDVSRHTIARKILNDESTPLILRLRDPLVQEIYHRPVTMLKDDNTDTLKKAINGTLETLTGPGSAGLAGSGGALGGAAGVFWSAINGGDLNDMLQSGAAGAAGGSLGLLTIGKELYKPVLNYGASKAAVLAMNSPRAAVLPAGLGTVSGQVAANQTQPGTPGAQAEAQAQPQEPAPDPLAQYFAAPEPQAQPQAQPQVQDPLAQYFKEQ